MEHQSLHHARVAHHVATHVLRNLPEGHAHELDVTRVSRHVQALMAERGTRVHVLGPLRDAARSTLLLVDERRSDLTGLREGLVHCITPIAPAHGAQPLVTLQQLMAERGWSAIRLVLHVEDEELLCERLAASRLRLGWMVTRKALTAAKPTQTLEVCKLRPVRRADMTFVRDGWRDAFRAGLQDEAGWQSDSAALDAADRQLARALRSRFGCLRIIEAAEGRVGFVAAEIGSPDLMSGRPECHLHDCYVRPELRGHGLSAAATAAIEGLAWERGCRFVTGTIAGASAERISAIAERIRPLGWRPYRFVYRARASVLAH